ncbi:MAG: HAD-IA family hydrolase [Advenella sp.]|uniref:HAD-IA family hydrolase n=1 Tax=Advenella sp. TaxID=1872388 RepID=UPI003F9CD259
MLKALIFDVDGTLADTETVHLRAFNTAFILAGLDWYWDEDLYTQLLTISGGKERMAHYWLSVDPEGASTLQAARKIREVHAIKTEEYARLVDNGQVTLRPGIHRLIIDAYCAGIPLAIATTTTSANVQALLHHCLGSDLRKFFATICDASTPGKKKPEPDVYLQALAELDVEASNCIALEDSENGLLAAARAGISTIITPTHYTAGQDFTGAMLVLPHLGDPDLPVPPGNGIHQTMVDLFTLKCLHADPLLKAG